MNLRSLLVAIALSVTACQPGSSPETARFEGETMGTTYLVQVSEPLSESERIAVSRAIQETLDDVNRTMSTYLPDSEVSQFNRAAAGVAVLLSLHTFEVFGEI